MYTKEDLTWGFELEVSNVPKNFDIPEHLGKWEFCEADIINTKGEYANICADPLGINPPVGGEINTKPTNTKEEQVGRIINIINMFRGAGYDPDCGMTSHSHIHVHIKGLEDDIDSLKKLFTYAYHNQVDLFNSVYGYNPGLIPEGYPKVKNYLKNDGSRKIPVWLVDNINNRATDLSQFLALFGKGISGYSDARPIRYGVNFYSLKNCRTIEFRCFRGSLNMVELYDSFEIVEKFILNGLNGGEPIKEVLGDIGNWIFPKMIFDEDQAKGWLTTKHHTELVKNKNRKFWEVK